jgi:hypothetical protein
MTKARPLFEAIPNHLTSCEPKADDVLADAFVVRPLEEGEV